MSDLSPDEVLGIVRRESPLAEKTLSGLRRAFSEFYLRYSGYEPLEVSQVRIGQADAYWVRSEGASDERTLLFFHGGGFTIGSSQDHMDLCARLSAAAKARVLSLDYRLAPEHPFPAAMEDSLAAFKWLLEHNTPPAGLGMAGISAGGNLVLTTLLGLRDAKLPLPAAAVCMSPATDLRFPGETARQNRPSDWITRGRLGRDSDQLSQGPGPHPASGLAHLRRSGRPAAHAGPGGRRRAFV